MRSLNSSFLVLITKVGGAHNIKDSRPINLVGNIYKLIAKVFSRRMVKIIDKVIWVSQRPFVEGKQILDVALITNEVVKDLL